MRGLLILALLFLSACPSILVHEENIEIITIGPYIRQDRYIKFNEDSGAWEFFFNVPPISPLKLPNPSEIIICFHYESIRGFDFEPGYIYTLEVRLEERDEGIQDVGRYAYHLIRIIEKEKAPDDFSYGW